MKSYPSIIYPPASGLGLRLHTWAKLDGSNLRFEWSRKKGWYKAGTRRRLLDETDPIFGPAKPLFAEVLAEDCERICCDQRWERAVIYCEYWGSQSFAGRHVEGDTMALAVIDVAPYKRGLLPPTQFLKLFGDLGPRYLGYRRWGKDFLNQVAQGLIEDASFEGVVGKTTEGRKPLSMYKAKTDAWKARVRELYSPEEAKRIIAS